MLVTNFRLGQYTNIQAASEDITDIINEIFFQVLDNCEIEFDQEELNNAAKEMIADLDCELKAENKTLPLFCYVNKIPNEKELFEYVKVQIMNNALQKTVLMKIAEQENILVTEHDLNLYKTEYRTRYSGIERDSIEQLEKDLNLVLLTKKVLAFLLEKNNLTYRKISYEKTT